MKRLVRLTLVVALALIGTALPAPEARAAEKPRYGGTLILPVDSNPSLLTPALTTDVITHTIGCKIFNGLAYLDRETGEMKPDLADSWEVSPDGKTFTFRLRGDVRWHDGKPLTSADVKFTFENILAKFHPRSRKAFDEVAGVDAPDARTVVVRFKRVYAPFLQQMTCMEAAIMPKHLYEGTDILKNPRNFNNPVGTGPFKWGRVVRGSHVELVKNQNYFVPGRPYLDRIIAKIIPDGAARVLALETGEVDFIQSYYLPKQEHARLSRNPNLKHKLDTDTPGDIFLMFNVTRGPWAKREVRQALMRATNFRLILERASFGLGNVPRGPFDTRYRWAFDAEDPRSDLQRAYPYDPKRANELLDQVGYPRKTDGTRFTLQLIYMTGVPLFPPIAEILRTNWKDAGVEVVLQPVERQVMVSRVYTKRDFDATLQPYTTAGDPAIGVHRAYQTVTTRRPFENPTGYSNPEVDELFARASATPDLRERGKHYKQAARILARDVASVIVLERGEVDYASKKFEGLWKSGMPYDKWEEVWDTGGRERP